jgi:glycosyltransferase involved in cell wall biosynthesis
VKQAARSPTRLAILVSHPIQHFVHFYRALAAREEIVLKVFFCSRIGLESYFDREMNCEIAWNMDLTSGFDHVFLPDGDKIKETSPLKVNNPSIWSALAEFQPDVVLTYGYNHLTTLRAVAWCRFHRIPVMMTGDSELLHERASWKTLLKAVGLPLLLRQFTCFLTTGDNNEDYYLHYGVAHDRFFRVPFSIDESNYRAARRDRHQLRRAFRATHGIDENAFVTLAVGKLSQRKRPRDLLQALETICNARKSRTPIHAVYAGNGALLDGLSVEAKDKKLPITFLGFVNVHELPAAHCAADVLVHASDLDPHPLVCSESACIGLPMIMSDRVGAIGSTDVARSGENTIVYPCGSVEVLADAITSLAGNPETASAMEKASQRIFDELDVRKSVQGLLAALVCCRDQRR